MIRVSIIGSGNVAQHLIQVFALTTGIDVVQVYARHPEPIKSLIPSVSVVTSFSELKRVDLCIIAVSDHSIAAVSQQLPFKNQLVVHTSGSVAMDDLDDQNRKGVFYPLQTLTKSKEVDFKCIPICLEAQSAIDFKLLYSVASLLSDSIYSVNSIQRKALHLSAVVVNNFVNHLYHIGATICSDYELDFAILKPLIVETANKINTLSPQQAQTGPALRGDTETINTHLAMLKEDYQKEIYKILTKSIIDNGK